MNKGQFFPYGDRTPREKFPIVTLSLIIINVLVFLWSLSDFRNIINSFGFIPASASILTVFTSMFLHGSFDHLFGNMWYLWIFGDNIEDKYGRVKYLMFYLLSGISATLVHFITNIRSTIPAVGASGAISGILGSYLVLFPKEKITVRFGYSFMHLPAYVVLGSWFLFQLFWGTMSLVGGMGSGIAFWAHIGGAVFGFAVTKLFKGRK